MLVVGSLMKILRLLLMLIFWLLLCVVWFLQEFVMSGAG